MKKIATLIACLALASAAQAQTFNYESHWSRDQHGRPVLSSTTETDRGTTNTVCTTHGCTSETVDAPVNEVTTFSRKEIDRLMKIDHSNEPGTVKVACSPPWHMTARDGCQKLK